MSESSVTIDGSHIAEASIDGVGIIEGTEYAYANDVLADIHGYDAAESVVEQAWERFYSPNDQDLTASDLLALVRREGKWRGRVSGRRQDGTDVPVDLSMRTTEDGVVCIVRERIEANGSRRRLPQPDDRSRQDTPDASGPLEFSETLLDALDDVLYVVDEEDNIVTWNQRLNDRLGYTDEEISELSLPDFLPEEHRELLGEKEIRMVDFPDRTREVDLVTRGGERIPHELRGATSTDERSGERYRVGIARDITERREREQRLERFETIFETIDDGVYALDEDFEIDLANEQLVEMLKRFGHSREEIFTTDAHELLLHDEERDSVETVRKRVLESETNAGSFEARAETPDGEPIVLESRFRLDPAPDGEYRGCIGIVRDITDRQERERKLRTARQFNEELVENAPFGMYRLDEDLRITYENPRAEEIIGLPDDEETSAAIGVDIRDLPSIVETGKAEVFTRLKDGETIEFEFPFESIYGREAYFSGRGVPLYRNGQFDGAVLMANDISERRQHERDLERQRDELDTLNRINELLLTVARGLFRSPVDGNIEETVCSRLADSDLYRFAWIGKPELGGDRLVPDASAGVDDEYLESITVTIDETETGQGPHGRAFRTGNIQVSQNIETDRTFDPWREVALNHDIRSAAAVPLAYEGTTYGILVVYASRPLAFSQREQRGFETLGEAIGYAINANRTRKLLFTEQVVELEFRVADADSFVVEASDRLGCRLSLEGYISTGNGSWLLYLSCLGGDSDRFVDAAREAATVEAVRTIGGGEEQIVALTTQSSLLNTVAALGGSITSGSFHRGHGSFVAEVPQSADVGEFIERLRSTYPTTELLAKRTEERSIEGSGWLPEDGPVDLTDKQRHALEAAYRAGYFEWPRECTAEDVAELLDISRPTLQAHLRKAEDKLLAMFLDATDRTGRAVDGNSFR